MSASCTLAIKAVPNAPRSAVAGWLGDALKVKVQAPPVEGRANQALCDFLADELRLPRRAVTVLRGNDRSRGPGPSRPGRRRKPVASRRTSGA